MSDAAAILVPVVADALSLLWLAATSWRSPTASPSPRTIRSTEMQRFNLNLSRVRPVRRYVGAAGNVYATISMETGECLLSMREARRVAAELSRIVSEADGGGERTDHVEQQADQRSDDGWRGSYVQLGGDSPPALGPCR